MTTRVRQPSWTRVEDYWARRLGSADSRQTALVEHGPLLEDYDGVIVVQRPAGLTVSVPSALAEEAARWQVTRDCAFDRALWDELLPGWLVLGPSIHSFLDHTDDLSEAGGAGPATVEEVAHRLRARVTESEWEESGFTGGVEHAWLLENDAGRPVAAANLTDFDGAAADVGVVVAADARGRGYAAEVGSAAARHAVRTSGIARWRSVPGNAASRRTARRLGFQDGCIQLAILPSA